MRQKTTTTIKMMMVEPTNGLGPAFPWSVHSGASKHLLFGAVAAQTMGKLPGGRMNRRVFCFRESPPHLRRMMMMVLLFNFFAPLI